ncbi:MAG: virulence RhuM family protein [Propionibacteriaceae bacterium]|nr:virulence RhuM family protein [Propionibacteriaceae bacterium]
MSTRKKPSRATDIVRSSAAEYLTFISASGGDETAVELRYEDENIWLTQKLMATLYGVTVQAIGQHLKRVFGDYELDESAVVKNFFTTASDGKSYSTRHYSLQAIIAVGFKVNNERAVQFRRWANQVVKDYTTQGWAMDVERLKSGHLFTDQYFKRQLELIREIRASERMFYQQVTDLYSTAFDYDPHAATTRDFFALVQKKLHWVAHRHTAAEVIIERADAEQTHMGLTSWTGAPNGKIVKSDVSVAKNYLTEDELNFLERLVSLYLDFAELQATRKIPMSMEDWATRLDGFLEFSGTQILVGPGRVSHEQAKLHAETEFEKYRIAQDRLFVSDFDRFLALADLDAEEGK